MLKESHQTWVHPDSHILVQFNIPCSLTVGQTLFYVLRTLVDLQLFGIYVFPSYITAGNTFVPFDPYPLPNRGAHTGTSLQKAFSNAC